MVLKMLSKIVGESNEKAVSKVRPIVKEINDLEPQFQAMTDEQLQNLTPEFRERLEAGETLDDLLPEAFAAVREASRRSVGMRHFDVQLVGGIVLHDGKIAEMKTGEGKTLVATLPAYLNALENGVHIVTVNDYLARRDAEWMGRIYHALGLTVGCLQNETSLIFDPDAEKSEESDEKSRERQGLFRAVTKRETYEADIVYGTNHEFGFDYLRDNMVDDISRVVQHDLHYAIVDEVDNILIDEARTPLIISGPAPDRGQEYMRYAELARRMTPDDDFEVDEKSRQISLSESGIEKAERFLGVANLYAPENYAMTHFVENAIRAEYLYLRDRAYVVRDGEVIIVDEFTGRLMHGRRYSEGLHQAIEAKEAVRVQQESITYATITLQNYFRMYEKLAGMTGTAATEAEEFSKIYKLDVVQIPTNRALIRADLADYIYRTEDAKFNAIVDTIADLHKQGRPVLVGTINIDKSEVLADRLRRRGVPHEVLNAKNHAREASIVAEAGRAGAVTVSTNMAGRGTDIVLGGNPDHLGVSREEWQAEHDRIVELGGLFVLGTERHESRRIDNQLRGRSGRQGDPGTTRFFISVEDELLQRFGGDRIGWVMDRVGLEDDTPIENRMVSKAVESAQAKVEGYHFEVRKNLVDYDDVINTHRDVIYKLRQKILRQESLRSEIIQMVRKELQALAENRLVGPQDDWNVDAFHQELLTIFPFLPEEIQDPEDVFDMERADIEEILLDEVERVHDQRIQEFGVDVMTSIERYVMLRHIDTHWVEHLTAMENMRQGIGLEAVGQRDPLVEYKRVSFQMFTELMSNIERDVAHMIYRVAPAPQTIQQAQQQQQQQQANAVAHQPGADSAIGASTASAPNGARRGGGTAVLNQRASVMNAVAAGHGRESGGGAKKLGRNDPCFCGSGKKYKRCHGAAA